MFDVLFADAVGDTNSIDSCGSDAKSGASSGKTDLQRQLHLITVPPPPPPNESKHVSNTVIMTQRTVRLMVTLIIPPEDLTHFFFFSFPFFASISVLF